ncbi:MAG TPA: hypothetical protein VN428_04215 [Bryobacteraceae bacterium]|nr:hypothetical protein [Bryobacteraceae bacterium]
MTRAVLCLFAAAVSPAGAEWIIAGYLGGASHDDTSLRVNQPELGTNVRFRDLQYRSNSFDHPLYYGARGGYFFNRHFGIDVELIHVKAYARTLQAAEASGTIEGRPVSGRILPATVLDRFSMSHGVNYLFTSFAARHDFMRPPGRDRGPITVFARVGGGQSIPHAESAFRGTEVEHYELGGVAVQVAGGVELQVWRSLGVLLEYKYTRGRQSVDVAFGEAEARLKTHHGIFGVVWHF